MGRSACRRRERGRSGGAEGERAHLLLLVAAVALVGGCATATPRFDGTIVWEDDDRHPIESPTPQRATKYWDILDHSLFRPLSRAFWIETPDHARNVNALGEVPDSSWYTNRLSVRDVSPQRVARGPCPTKAWDLDGDWRITGLQGEGHGTDLFVTIEGTGRDFRLRFGDEAQPGRATAADVVGSRTYWAAGFETPCIRIAHVRPEQLELAEGDASMERLRSSGPPTEETLADILEELPRREGAYRVALNPRLPGRPLGPFDYTGTREDDPNDVVPHQDRRELRGARVFAAWIGHFDVRRQNTATTFITEKDESRGYVQHFLTDFDDALGPIWFSKPVSRRFSHAYYLDFGHVVVDLATLGLVPRPWHEARTGRPHPVFGYFRAEDFHPRAWKPGTPNPAFRRMDHLDAFWAAKIVGRFSDAHIRRIVERARLRDAADERYLVQTLRRRRNRIVWTYLTETAPFVFPRLREGRLCFEDLLVAEGYAPLDEARYRVRRANGTWQEPMSVSRERICAEVSDVGTGGYAILEARVRRTNSGETATPTRFHLRRVDDRLRVVGIVR